MNAINFINSPLPFITKESCDLAVNKVYEEKLTEFEVMPERDFIIASENKDGEKYIFFGEKGEVDSSLVKDSSNWKRFFSFGCGSIRLVVRSGAYTFLMEFALVFGYSESAELLNAADLCLFKNFSEKARKTIDEIAKSSKDWNSDFFTIQSSFYNFDHQEPIFHDFSEE